MKQAGIMGTAALFLLLGTTVPMWAQPGKQGDKQGKSDKQGQNKGKGNAKAGAQQKEQHGAPQAKHEAKRERVPDNGNFRRAQRPVIEDRPVVVRQQQGPDNRPPGWDRGKKVGWNGGTVPPGHQARLPRSRQQELIVLQQTRRVDYRRSLDQQRALQARWTTQQQRDRMTYYRYQQDYWSRMRRQQLALQRNYNYNNDPYFYTASNYTYNYGGNNYETNQYGAKMLRAAVNNGYAEGYRAGQADRRDSFGGGYQNSYAYQDANLGYNGNYVNQGDYNHYFREGFNRGYQDGYGNQMQYGQYSNGNRSILGTVLSTILNLQSLR